jgi:hypothetical protein
MDEGFGGPEEYGMNSETCVLEMWTEFMEAPAVEKMIHVIDEGLADETLLFGETRIEAGKAFVLGDVGNSIPVAKAWIQADDRTFLAEAVRYSRMRPLLDGLQAQAGKAKDQPVRRAAQVVNDRRAIIAQFVRADKKEQLVADMSISAAPKGGALLNRRAVVLDYQTVNGNLSSPWFTNGTYRVSGPTYLSGEATFSGGAVFKYDVGAMLQVNSGATVKFEGSAYRPVIFTGKDDNSVGQVIAGSTGSPGNTYYANPALSIWFNAQSKGLSNLRIRHAQLGLNLQYDANVPNGVFIRHAQFVDCQGGISVNFSGATGVKLQNALFHEVNDVISGYDGRVQAAHVTVNDADHLISPNAVDPVLILWNSLLVNVATPGSFSGSGNAVETSGTIFQSSGEGMHYLAAGSPHRNQGTAQIDSALAADLKKMTT